MFDKGQSADDLVQRGLALHKQGRLAEARPLYAAALASDPGHAEALHLMGLAAYQQGDFDEALARIEAAIRQRPGVAKYHSNRGNALKEKGRLEEAIAAYRQAIALDAAFADAPFNLGVALREAGDAPGAAQAFQAALRLNPSNVDTRQNLATALYSLGRHDQSIDLFREVLKARPNAAEVHFNLSQTLERAGRYAEAIAEARVALALAPAYAAAAAALHFLMRRCCAWEGMSEVAAVVDADIDAAGPGVRVAETPFLNVGRCDDPARNLAVARSWGNALANSVLPLFERRPPSPRAEGRIRLGYLSSDMQSHAVGQLMRGLLRRHDHGRFHVSVYSYGRDDGSAYRQDIVRVCDAFVDIRDLAHADAARRIHADGTDILVDLNGWTRGHRLAICAHRPAPVQVGFLGYPGTTGCPFIDYAIVDSVVVPPAHAGLFSEALVFLPDCYLVTDDGQAIAGRGPSRAEAGLPADAFVFCSFNGPAKVEPVMFDAWMRILGAVPGSVLWLRHGDDLADANLRAEAERRGVAGDRLVFARAVPSKDDHLFRMGLADLGLDTRIYNGHTTTADTLWAGVPVVALEGRHFASRVAVSCLKAVGLDELATPTLDAYEALAIRLACRPDEIGRLRERLAANRLAFPLFDTARFARHIEQAFETMWRRHEGGERPSPIVVPPCRAVPTP